MLIITSRSAFGAAFASYHSNHYGPVGITSPAEIAHGPHADIVVFDAVNIPAAFARLAELSAVYPDARLVMLVARPCDLVLRLARRHGADAVISEADDVTAWHDVLSRIHQATFLSGPSFRDAPAFATLLTARQVDVYLLAARGLSDEEAAEELGISVATFETHRRDAQIKLGCGGHRELVAHAIRHGIVDASEVPLLPPLRRATRLHCTTALME